MSNKSNLLKTLFATFPPQTGDPVAMMEAYDLALEIYEPRDIEAAVTKFLRGQVLGFNENFAPSAPKLASIVRQCLDDRLDSERRANPPRLLPEPEIVHTPESIARVKALAAQFSGTVAAMRTPDAAADKRAKEFQARLDERFMPDMSPEAIARRLLKIGDPEGDRDVA